MNWVLDTALKVAAILAVALIAVPALRRQSASVRHGVLTAAVFIAAIAPVLGLLLPAWHLAQPIAMPLPAATVEQTTQTSTAATDGAAQAIVPFWMQMEHLPQILWFIGVCFGVVALFTGWLRLVRLVSASRPVTNRIWMAAAEEICRDYGLRRSVRLLQSPNPSILVTWGLLRPRVLVPSGAEDWTPERIEVVLRHELAHVRRGDWLVQVLAESLRAIYWFNPLFWMVCYRLRLESEFACDDAVITRGVSGTDYASHLLDLARVLNKPDRAWSAALAMARPSTVERRFTAMLNPALNRRPPTRRTMAAIIGVIFCISLPLAAMTLSPEILLPPVPAVLTVPPQAPLMKVTGTVTDTLGATVSGATVILSTPDGRTQGTTSTNGAGIYSFSGLQAGTYVLQVFANSFGPSRLTNINVESGRDLRQDMKMDIGFVQDAAPAGAGSISGKVVDARGLLIPGVQVTLASTQLPGGNRSTTTDDKGTYSFESLPRGPYQLSSKLPGFKTLNIEGIRVLDRPLTVNAKLEVASIAETITIISSATAPTPPPADAPACIIPPPGEGPRVAVGGNVRAPMLLGQVKPIYPAEARNQGVQGVVIFEAVIGLDGRVANTKLITGHPLLAPAATDAVKQWCYKPTLLDGQPIEVVSTVTVNFVLKE